jgi:dehydrogenase/reductase SDR family member 1
VAYSVGKTGVDRLTQTMAVDLLEHGVAVVSLWPGMVRTERMIRAAELGDGAHSLDGSESPELSGRAVVALAQDPDVLERTGTVQVVASLAHEYGFTEDDGTQPPVI